MSELFLMPRLSSLGFRRFHTELEQLAGLALSARLKALEDFISYGASGGTRLPALQLERFREGLVMAASSEGFPAKGSTAGRSRFDARCAAWLHEDGTVRGAEALRDDLWTFVACALAPDVAIWRFEGAHSDRFRGGVRNTFQRLWLRGAALDGGEGSADRWTFLEKLGEDALVQITERPAIASDRRLARAIARAWVATAEKIGARRMEDVTRQAIRMIRVANETICFSALDDTTLDLRLGAYFRQAAE